MGVKARKWLWENGYRFCAYCGCKLSCCSIHPGRKLSVDHVVARDFGGSNKKENLTSSCIPCNSRKSNTAIRKKFDPKTGESW